MTYNDPSKIDIFKGNCIARILKARGGTSDVFGRLSSDRCV
jgi:hypothetical protein